MKRSCLAVLLVLALLCGCCSCGKSRTNHELKIGALFSDNADATGISHYHLLGLQKTAEEMDLGEPVCKFALTDVSFDASVPVTAGTTKVPETTAAPEPESYTAADGEVILRGVPIEEKAPESAVAAAADLIGQGCNVIVAADPVFDDLTAYLAGQFDDVTFLQYGGTHTDQKNLQCFSDNLYEAFYLAGAVAGCEDIKQIGFTGRTGNNAEKDCINAFALGVSKTNPDAAIDLRLTNVEFDLYLERTVPLELIETDKCGLLAQSVYTALPVCVAAGTDGENGRDPLPCIGFGYDMQADGGERYLCSVVFDFSVYYTAALTALRDGTFDASPYTGGVREGIVGLSTLQHASDKAKKTLQSLLESAQQDRLHPLEGFTPAQNGYADNITAR